MHTNRRNRRSSHPLASVAAVACSMWMAACSATSSEPAAAAGESSSAGAPKSGHAMRTGELQDVMKSFDAAVRKDVPAEIDEHDRWEGVYPRIADAAAKLEVAARELAGHPPKGLELPARGRFSVLGRSLAEAAARLKDAAASNDADAVAIARNDVAGTCRGCHDQFRPDSEGIPEAFE